MRGKRSLGREAAGAAAGEEGGRFGQPTTAGRWHSLIHWLAAEKLPRLLLLLLLLLLPESFVARSILLWSSCPFRGADIYLLLLLPPAVQYCMHPLVAAPLCASRINPQKKFSVSLSLCPARPPLLRASSLVPLGRRPVRAVPLDGGGGTFTHNLPPSPPLLPASLRAHNPASGGYAPLRSSLDCGRPRRTDEVVRRASTHHSTGPPRTRRPCFERRRRDADASRRGQRRSRKFLTAKRDLERMAAASAQP